MPITFQNRYLWERKGEAGAMARCAPSRHAAGTDVRPDPCPDTQVHNDVRLERACSGKDGHRRRSRSVPEPAPFRRPGVAPAEIAPGVAQIGPRMRSAQPRRSTRANDGLKSVEVCPRTPDPPKAMPQSWPVADRLPLTGFNRPPATDRLILTAVRPPATDHRRLTTYSRYHATDRLLLARRPLATGY